MKRSSKVPLGCLVAGGWIGMIMLFLAIWQFLSPERPPVTQIAYSELVALVNADRDHEPHVEAATIKGQAITFWVKDPKTNSKIKRAAMGPEKTDQLAREMIDHHVAVVFEEDDSGASFTPLVFLFLIFASIATAFYAWMKLVEVRRELTNVSAELARLKARLDQQEEEKESPGDAT